VTVETGHFEGFPSVVCAMGLVPGGEHTLCGDAYDVYSEGEGHGAWVETGKPVNCVQCVEIIRAARAVRLAPTKRHKERQIKPA